MSLKFIISRENPFFKQLIKLKNSARQRRATGQTLLDGVHLINAYRLALGSPKNLILSESGCANAEIKALLDECKTEDSDVVVLNDTLFREICTVKTPTGVMAVVAIPSSEAISGYGGAADEVFYVLLEAIQDPGNLGSILRSAAAAGANDAFLSDNCADAWSPKTLRAGMGAHFLIRIHEQSDLAEVARKFKGKVIATSLTAEKSLYETGLSGSVALVFGNEAVGLSEEVLHAASEQIRIPMTGETESLNAAAAAAVCFFERVRQMTSAGNIQD